MKKMRLDHEKNYTVAELPMPVDVERQCRDQEARGGAMVACGGLDASLFGLEMFYPPDN